MDAGHLASTIGVVVLHRPDQTIATLPAICGLITQVDRLLIVVNGSETCEELSASIDSWNQLTSSITFDVNRGTAAAYNAALKYSKRAGIDYIYFLDQDSEPWPAAVDSALRYVNSERVGAVVQPPSHSRFRLAFFPWNTVASGSLLRVDALEAVGGFDERLFVDEVDHEALARLMRGGYTVRALPTATIKHAAGMPRQVRIMGQTIVLSGHSVDRRWLQGYSAGLLIRRNLHRAPATSIKLALSQSVTAAKDVAAGERRSARSLFSGLAEGIATRDPPMMAAERACPYCEQPLVGCFGTSPNSPGRAGIVVDLYLCSNCKALSTGASAPTEEIATEESASGRFDAEPVSTSRWHRTWSSHWRYREMEKRKWCPPAEAPTRRFLDVGAGSGERLVRFLRAGWDVVGQDIEPSAGSVARDRGIMVHRVPLKELLELEKPFDLIALNHVLERSASPFDILNAGAALLHSNGRIRVLSTNARALRRENSLRSWLAIERPKDFALPTIMSLRTLAYRLGLKPIRATTVPFQSAVIIVWLGRSLDHTFP